MRFRKDSNGKELLIKSFPFEVKECEIKGAHEDDNTIGIIRGYASTFGNEDRGADIVAPGAFDRTLLEHRQRNNRPIRLYANHNSTDIIGGIPINSVVVDSIGLFVEAEIDLNVQRGAEIFSLAQKGFISDFSIGFSLRKAEFNQETGVRTLLDIELFEVSPVNEPMNPLATITDVEGNGKRVGDPNYRPKEKGMTVFTSEKGETITLDKSGKIVTKQDNIFTNEKGEKIKVDEDGEVTPINEKGFTKQQVETLKTNADAEGLLKDAGFSKSARKALISKIKGFDTSGGRDDSEGDDGRDDQSNQGRDDSAEKSALSTLSDLSKLLKPNEGNTND